jgi:predicted HD phosphohydrolase
MSTEEPKPRATFRSMDQSTAADWAIIMPEYLHLASGLAKRVLAHLLLLDGDTGGFPVDRLHHSRLTATLALEAGEDEEYVACALLHDIGDTLGTWNHPDVAAVILRPFVSDDNHWMVDKHGIFQGYNFFHHIGMDRNMRDRLREHPGYDRAARFVESYDNRAFDPALPCLPLERFVPIVERVFAAPKKTVYRVGEGSEGSPGKGA